MPGIHPSSRQQVKWAFAAEARGQLRPNPNWKSTPPPDAPWTSPEAKRQGSIAREWAHRWKCWTWDPRAREGARLPKDCKSAMALLEKLRREQPHWKVPAGLTAPPPRLPAKVRVLERPSRAPALPIAARYGRVPKPARAALEHDVTPRAARPRKTTPKKLPSRSRGGS
jgi:hypothetical protein